MDEIDVEERDDSPIEEPISYSGIKLRAVRFAVPPFRKLKNLDIKISDRLTVIGGHNGIGKSTILGMIANGSGVKSAKHKSYFDLPFQAIFHELFALSETYDYKVKVAERGSVHLDYELLTGSEATAQIFTKKCNVTKHREKGGTRLKIVPRTVNKKLGELMSLSNDGRVPIPTIYLGMSRVNPIGELDKDTVSRSMVRTFDPDDAAYFRRCLKRVVDIDLDESENTMVSHSFKGSKKRSKLPKLNFDSLAISAGQDSLSSIVTALASFKRLARQMGPEYPGGVLVIDEIDAGLHPHAQVKLIQLLKAEARKLRLQVIATSHSLIVMKELLDIDEAQKEHGKLLDSVVYITDSTAPVVMENPSYKKIETNIFLKRPELDEGNDPTIKVYFEDLEAKYFFERILQAFDLEDRRNFGVKFDLIASGIGCHTLLSLADADDYFETVMIVFDGDVLSEQSARETLQKNVNYLALPLDVDLPENAPAASRTPEMVLHRYLNHLYNVRPAAFWMKTLEVGFDGDQLREHILDLDKYRDGGKPRDTNKNWFRQNQSYFDSVHLMDFWAKDNAANVNSFIEAVRLAVQHLLNRRR